MTRQLFGTLPPDAPRARSGEPPCTLGQGVEPGDLGTPAADDNPAVVLVKDPRPDFDRPLKVDHRPGCRGFCTCPAVTAC